MKMQEPVLKEDLARRDGLQGDIAALENLGALPREAVLLIHGTSANKVASPPAWWLPDSDFCRKLNSVLSQQGSAARCRAHIGNGKSVFAWTGDNLETERRIAGERLAKEITDLEANRDISRYHIVAHSHGGNVVLHALRSLADDPKNLGAVIFLGTPVLRFSRLPPWLNRNVLAMLFYGMGLVASITGALLAGESQFVSILKSSGRLSDALVYGGSSWILVAITFGSLLLDEWWMWTKPPRQLPIYGSGHAHAFEFADDEAMKALQLAMGIAERPNDVLKQLFSTKASPEYAVDLQRPKFWKVIWLDFKKTAPYRIFDLGWTAERRQAARGMKVGEKFAYLFGHVWRAARSRSKSPVQRLVSIFIIIYWFLYLLAIAGVLVMIVVAMIKGREAVQKPDFIPAQLADLPLLVTLTFPFIAIAVFMLIIIIFMSLLSALFKFAKLGLAWVAHLFWQRPGAWIMGRVVRDAAFGGPCKQVLRPQELPEKERARSEAISEKLNQEMNDLSRATAAQAGQALYSAFTKGDATQLKKHIFEQLTDPKLAHCQYYCEGEIIYRIAELIATADSIHPSEAGLLI